MGIIKSYYMVWVIALASSIGFYLVSAIVALFVTPADVATMAVYDFILSSTALLFNTTASGFILLTMIPIAGAVIIVGLAYNIAAPTLLPFLGAILDPWMYGLMNLFGGTHTPIASSYVFFDIATTIDSVVKVLESVKGLLIQEIISTTSTSV
jgi:hypothetical protein